LVASLVGWITQGWNPIEQIGDDLLWAFVRALRLYQKSCRIGKPYCKWVKGTNKLY
jgi:hypothetical protein